VAETTEARPTVSRPATSAAPSSGPRKLTFKERREFEELEKAIERSEARKAEVERQLAASSSDFVLVEALYIELQQLNRQLERDVDRWGELAELA
jgi:ATP-binding cassette subfamily F protein uup